MRSNHQTWTFWNLPDNLVPIRRWGNSKSALYWTGASRDKSKSFAPTWPTGRHRFRQLPWSSQERWWQALRRQSEAFRYKCMSHVSAHCSKEQLVWAYLARRSWRRRPWYTETWQTVGTTPNHDRPHGRISKDQWMPQRWTNFESRLRRIEVLDSHRGLLRPTVQNSCIWQGQPWQWSSRDEKTQTVKQRIDIAKEWHQQDRDHSRRDLVGNKRRDERVG